MRAKAVFSPAFPRVYGEAENFFCFLLSGEKRWQISRFCRITANGGSGSQSRRFPAIDVPIWNVKIILCFISEQKQEKFFCSRSPYSDCIAPVRSRFRLEPQAEQDDARAHHVKHALI
jgi:hypothetical protein